jgi:hypothetical protein
MKLQSSGMLRRVVRYFGRSVDQLSFRRNLSYEPTLMTEIVYSPKLWCTTTNIHGIIIQRTITQKVRHYCEKQNQITIINILKPSGNFTYYPV